MRSVVTFFRSRERDPGKTYRLTVARGGELLLLEVYTAKPIRSSLLNDDRSYKNHNKYNDFFRDLEQKVGEVGGCIVVTGTAAGGQAIRIIANQSSGYIPPRHVMLLDSGREPKSLEYQDRKINLLPRSHLVLPVHEAAENKLNSFVGDLSWFSKDLESLVLNGIRRPSLDVRVERLEEDVFPQEAASSEPGQQGAGTFWAKAKRLASKPVPLGPVLAGVLLFMLVANVGYISALLSNVTGMELAVFSPKGASLTPPPSTPPPSTPPPSTPPPSTPPSPPPDPQPLPPSRTPPGGSVFQAPVGTCYRAISLRKNEVGILKILYDAHFSGHSQTVWSGAKAASVLRGKGSRPFIWGLIKMQALKLRPGITDTGFLESDRKLSATKSVFREIGLEAIRSDPEGFRMLCALACGLEYDTPESKTGLPAASGNSAFVFEDVPCENQKPEDVIPGLMNLTKFVADYGK